MLGLLPPFIAWVDRKDKIGANKSRFVERVTEIWQERQVNGQVDRSNRSNGWVVRSDDMGMGIDQIVFVGDCDDDWLNRPE